MHGHETSGAAAAVGRGAQTSADSTPHTDGATCVFATPPLVADSIGRRIAEVAQCAAAIAPAAPGRASRDARRTVAHHEVADHGEAR